MCHVRQHPLPVVWMPQYCGHSQTNGNLGSRPLAEVDLRESRANCEKWRKTFRGRKKMDLWFSGAEGSHRFGMVLGVAFLVFSVWNKVPQTITNHMINYEKWEWKLSRKRPSSIDAGPSGVRKVSGEDCVVSIAPLLSLNAVPVVAVGQDLGSINPIPSAVASPLQNGLRVGGYPLLA